jgi:signal transduction histidine kinase
VQAPIVVTHTSHVRRHWREWCLPPAIPRVRDGGIPGRRDATAPTSRDNGSVSSGAGTWRGRADRVRQLASAPDASALAGAVFTGAALVEVLVRFATGTMSTGYRQYGWAFFLLALFTTAPLALLRPAGAALAVCAAGVLSLAGFHTLTAGGFAAQVVALYQLGFIAAGSDSPGDGDGARRGGQLLAVALALPFFVLALAGSRPASSEAAFLTALLAALCPAAALGGIAQQARREARENSAAREVIASTLVDHTARGERARIARELHDVVAHHISMVSVQAETARLTTPGMPPAGAQRLSAIGDTARAALTEMRRLLGVLRTDTGTDAAERQPQPGLRQLNDLLDEAREASGAGTRLILSGPPVVLDPGVELAAYRIAQEALTNARRHAPGAAVDVELIYTDDAIRLRIRDNGPGPPVTASLDRHGLAGMRERAAAVGGELHAGPTVVGGFLVEATLPAKTGD